MSISNSLVNKKLLFEFKENLYATFKSYFPFNMYESQ